MNLIMFARSIWFLFANCFYASLILLSKLSFKFYSIFIISLLYLISIYPILLLISCFMLLILRVWALFCSPTIWLILVYIKFLIYYMKASSNPFSKLCDR